MNIEEIVPVGPVLRIELTQREAEILERVLGVIDRNSIERVDYAAGHFLFELYAELPTNEDLNFPVYLS